MGENILPVLFALLGFAIIVWPMRFKFIANYYFAWFSSELEFNSRFMRGLGLFVLVTALLCFF